MCLTVWRPKVCRGWEEQHRFSLHVLVDLSVSWGAERSEGIWSFLEQSETNNIINDQILFSKQNMLISGLASRRSHPTRCACGWPWQPWRPPKAAALPCLGGFLLPGFAWPGAHHRFEGHQLAPPASHGVTALVAALDEDMMAIFWVSFWISFVLYIQVFKCNNQHPASTGQWNISMRSLCGRFKIFEPGAIWHKSFGDKSILSLRLRYC